MKPKADRDRVWQELDTLASMSDADPPAVTRVVFSETDLRARRFFKDCCAAAGLELREDAVGNTFARWRFAPVREREAQYSGAHA